jgi:heme-degrading monooxygenase HmoA
LSVPIYELRTYVLYPHNRERLYERFRDHTSKILTRLGFHTIGYWTVSAGEGEGNLVYLIRWESHADREAGWRSFAEDTEWQEVRAATNAEHGPLVAAAHSAILSPTDYSRLQ